MIARRAAIAQLIGLSRPLIVVGAGAGGVAAALAADSAGIPVVVIERGTRPFDRQLRTSTRTIYPYLYDWPHDRHTVSSLAVPAVLPWLEARSDHAAQSWVAALGGRRFIVFGSTVSPPSPGANDAGARGYPHPSRRRFTAQLAARELADEQPPAVPAGSAAIEAIDRTRQRGSHVVIERDRSPAGR